MNLCIVLKYEVTDAMGSTVRLDGLPGSEQHVGDSHSSQTVEAGWMGVHATPSATITTGRGAGTGTFSLWAWMDIAHAENRAEQEFLLQCLKEIKMPFL